MISKVLILALVASAAHAGLVASYAPALTYAAPKVAVAAPLSYASYAAPAVTYAHAAPAIQYAHAAPAITYAHAAPAITYAHAAPAIQYAAPRVYAAAPAVHYAPAPIVKVAAAPLVKTVVVEADAHPQYSYKYGVNDPSTGDHKSAEETRDGDHVQGSYSLAEADGSIRTVHYTADDHNGFNAVVEKTAPTKVVVAAAPKYVSAPAYAYHH